MVKSTENDISADAYVYFGIDIPIRYSSIVVFTGRYTIIVIWLLAALFSV